MPLILWFSYYLLDFTLINLHFIHNPPQIDYFPIVDAVNIVIQQILSYKAAGTGTDSIIRCILLLTFIIHNFVFIVFKQYHNFT